MHLIGEQPYSCDQCNNTFSRSSSLRFHKKAVHQQIRSHVCEQCGKCFVAFTNLERHMFTHTGERPFACDQCDKSFSQSNTLKTHKQSVHEQIRPHACDQCDKRFAQASDLKNHSRTHTGEFFTILTANFVVKLLIFHLILFYRRTSLCMSTVR